MITIGEIEEKLKRMSDFLKIEYLEELAEKKIPVEVKRYVHEKIAELYADKKMYSSAAKNMEIAASLCVTFKDKIKAYMKEVEFLIYGEDYNEAERTLAKALSNANTKEKEEIKKQFTEILKKQAELYERNGLRIKAIKVYERLLKLTPKREIVRKLIELNEKTGRIDEVMRYREMINKIEE